MKRTIHFSLILLTVASVFLSACSDEDSAKGKVQLYITDAPVDDENVSGVFLSIKGVELKGSGGWETVAEYETPIEINILDYQEGDAYFLTEEMLTAGTYTEARLILDAPAENGPIGVNPGCYIQYNDNSTEPLFIPSGAQSGYKVKGEFTLNAGGTVAVTLDFDVRKSIVVAGTSSKFLLKPVVRLIANTEAALIEGNYADVLADERIVVYAYETGTFTESEIEVSEETGVRFSNAITSTQLDDAGDFTLAFMAAGDYDLVFVSVDEDGEPIEVLGAFSAEVSSGSRLELAITLALLTAI